jgi:REP element-mobilizing transposase RayT
MSRPLRLEFPGALWHATSRGVEQRTIFLDDADREYFLRVLEKVIDRYRWQLHAYVLMSNHYHLLLTTPEPTLSRGMQQLGGEYAEHFNEVHTRVGHLFQGRFKSHLVDSETYLLEVSRYIVLNPVRAGMVETAGDWRWSSYAATAGLRLPQRWLVVEAILDRLHPQNRSTAAEWYRDFVAAGVSQSSSPWEKLVAQAFLGSEKFLRDVEQKVRAHEKSTEYPREQRELNLTSLEHVRACVDADVSDQRTRRQMFALLARTESLATLGEIGRSLNIGVTAAHYLVRAAQTRLAKDVRFAALRIRTKERIKNCH